jgi:hypothetical protein
MIGPQPKTGQTTKQLRDAPPWSIFIWCNSTTVDYPRTLARRMGRDDLRVEPLSVLDEPHRLSGHSVPALILDHAAHLNDRQRATFEMLGSVIVRV